MIIKFKTINNHNIQTINSDEMSFADKINFIRKTFNFDIIILDENGVQDFQKRLEILRMEF